jgi:hypothetical protein
MPQTGLTLLWPGLAIPGPVWAQKAQNFDADGDPQGMSDVSNVTKEGILRLSHYLHDSMF